VGTLVPLSQNHAGWYWAKTALLLETHQTLVAMSQMGTDPFFVFFMWTALGVF
jgi:hypothetical protein